MAEVEAWGGTVDLEAEYKLVVDAPGGRNPLIGLRRYSTQGWGRCQIEEFVPGLDAGHYVSKEMCEVGYSPIYAWGLGEEKMDRGGAAAFRM